MIFQLYYTYIYKRSACFLVGVYFSEWPLFTCFVLLELSIIIERISLAKLINGQLINK